LGVRYQKNKARRTDGGNWNAHTVHGKHTRNPGYVPGQNWVECMRCGLDYRHSDIKREWTGLVVCKTCWEPRHPQDFVRARTDRIAAPGPNNTAAAYSTVAAEGSTDVPPGTFAVGFTGSLGSIADQTNTNSDTITTISAAAQFPTVFNDGITEWTVSGWQLSSAPDGIAIDTSGDIDGTMTQLSDDDSPYLTSVTAFYGEGQEMTLEFNWTVTDAGVAPDAVANTCWGWWDFSESAGNFCKQNSNDTVAVADESDIKRVNSRCGSGNHLIPDQANESAYTGIWDANVRNGNGAFLPLSDNETTGVKTLESDNIGTITQAYTLVGVVQIPVGLNPEGNWWAGQTNSVGHNFGISPDETGNVGSWEVMRTNPTTYFSIDVDSQSMTSIAGEWYVWWIEIPEDPALGTLTYNEEVPGTPMSVDTVGMAASSFRLGAKNLNTTTNGYYGWDSYIGEVIMYEGLLSASDKSGLYTWLKDKWALTDLISS